MLRRFNLRHRVLCDCKIKILEKDIDIGSIQRKMNEIELRKDFEEFCRRRESNGIFGMTPHQVLAL